MKTPKAYFYLLSLLVVFSCEKLEDVHPEPISVSTEINQAEHNRNYVDLLKKTIELREAVLIDYLAVGDSNIEGQSGFIQLRGCYYAYSDATALLEHIMKTPELYNILNEAQGFLEPLVVADVMLINDEFDVYQLLVPGLGATEVRLKDFIQYIIKHPEDQIQCREVLKQVNDDVARIVTEIVTVTINPEME